MKESTFFVISDVHSFYEPMMQALNESGFDRSNPNHWLISCGDNFDRGPQSAQVLKFLRELPRKILIKGNHEKLLEDCCTRGFPLWHDKSNGTTKTILQLGHGESFEEKACYTMERLSGLFKEMRFFFETETFIFTHSWIPSGSQWRTADEIAWNRAMWANPFACARNESQRQHKPIVHGHWHASAGWAMEKGTSEFGEDACFDPYYGPNHVAIDACTAHTGKVNCLVITDAWLQDPADIAHE